MPRMSESGSGGFNYNDLQYQYIGFDRNVTSTETPTEAQAFTIDTEPIDERELDHNQLAELCYLRRHFMLQVDEDPADSNQTSTGNLQVAGTLEVNSGEREWLNSDQRDPEYVEENNRNLDLSEFTYSVGWENQSGSAGGPGGGETASEREAVFSGPQGMFDHGPVLDPNDEINVRYEIDKRNVVVNCRFRAYYVLGWKVHEVENARPEFGIPL